MKTAVAMVRNLSTPENREQFRNEFQKLVETEAQRLCRNRMRAQQLAEYVFLKVEKDYAVRILPDYCEPFLAGQTCLAYAATGGNPARMQEKIDELRTGSGNSDV